MYVQFPEFNDHCVPSDSIAVTDVVRRRNRLPWSLDYAGERAAFTHYARDDKSATGR